MAKQETSGAERWSCSYRWRRWIICRDRGWFLIAVGYDGVSPAAPVAFRELKNAKRFCETLEMLNLGTDEIHAAFREGDTSIIVADVLKQMSLDGSRAVDAEESRRMAEEFTQRRRQGGA